MRRFSACLGVCAMLVALFTAPLFHSHDQHDQEEHDSIGSLVHAHFEELEEAEHHDHGIEIEDRHAHHSPRWIEFFTFSAPSPAFNLNVELTDSFTLPTLEEREQVVIATVPSAHDPPADRPSAPRPPPSA